MRQAIRFMTSQRRSRGAAWATLLAVAASAALTAIVIEMSTNDTWSQIGQVLGAAG